MIAIDLNSPNWKMDFAIEITRRKPPHVFQSAIRARRAPRRFSATAAEAARKLRDKTDFGTSAYFTILQRCNSPLLYRKTIDRLHRLILATTASQPWSVVIISATPMFKNCSHSASSCSVKNAIGISWAAAFLSATIT